MTRHATHWDVRERSRTRPVDDGGEAVCLALVAAMQAARNVRFAIAPPPDAGAIIADHRARGKTREAMVHTWSHRAARGGHAPQPITPRKPINILIVRKPKSAHAETDQ